MNIFSILTGCPLFRGLSEEKIATLLDGNENFILADYCEGEYIARRDMAYSGLMIILKGKVHGEITYPSGKRIRLETIEAPQLIAPAFLFGGYNRLPIDVIAEGEVTIMTIHRGYLFEMMQANMLVLSNFIDIISNRANVWSKRIYLLSFLSLKERVAAYLLEQTSPDTDSLPVPDIAEITERFDATRSAVLTVLGEMEKKHLIRMDREHIRILNRAGLDDIFH